ncbi:MAG: hypothetical protein R3B60_01680 [Candidatus Paceibacterota bacterium]
MNVSQELLVEQWFEIFLDFYKEFQVPPSLHPQAALIYLEKESEEFFKADMLGRAHRLSKEISDNDWVGVAEKIINRLVAEGLFVKK